MQKLTALVLGLGLSLPLGGCGGSGDAVAEPAGAAAEPVAAGVTAAEAPAPTGEVVEVKMITDGAGNYFEPAELTVNKGDVVRFVLESGVHNVSFPTADNAGAVSLPEASPYLQLPGQTYDLVVGLEAGSYTFVCDPHAALGMVGTLNVQ